jgi:hypothetical protein
MISPNPSVKLDPIQLEIAWRRLVTVMDEVDAAVVRTNRILSEAEISPNYQKLLDHGDARSVGDILAAGSEAAIEKRLRAFADAGTTDVSVRVVPIGADRDALIASSKRTREYLASLQGVL